MTNNDYAAHIESWRADLETKLRADNSWLTLAGLLWLQEGDNPVGAHPSNPVELPPGSAPDRVGNFELHHGTVTFHALPGVNATVKGAAVSAIEMKPDSSGGPTVLNLNALTMQVIQRGEQLAIRLWDNNSETRRAFTGRRWFPVDETYRVTAEFVPYDPPRSIDIVTIIGTVEPSPNPGYVTFTLNGQPGRLEALARAGNILRFLFRDLTSGVTTYPTCRYVDADQPTNGRVVLDFNKSTNLPCAFTAYATCPIPPAQNNLAVAIEAGERYEGHH